MKPSIYSLENQTKHVLGIAVLIHSCVASFLITHFNHSKYYARITMDKFALKQQNKRNRQCVLRQLRFTYSRIIYHIPHKYQGYLN